MLFKKKCLHLLVILAFCLGGATYVEGAITREISYQGVLRNNDGTLVDDGSYQMRFCMFLSPTSTGALWCETKYVTTVDGIFETRLGDTVALTPSFASDTWLEVAIKDGASFIELGERILIAPSPSALFADKVGSNTITSTELANGAVTEANLATGAVTGDKIDDGAAVKSLNTLTGQVGLVGGANVTVTPQGNDLRIDAVSGAGGDDGDWTISGNHLTHDTAGVVAIGTGSPTHSILGHALLQIQATSYPGIALDATNPSFNRWLIFQNALSQDLLFSRATGTGLGTLKMVLDDTGKLGIGINAPEATLDILGGNYMLNTLNPGDFQIGGDGNALQFGIDTDGNNAGRVKIRAVGTAPFMNFSLNANAVMTFHPGEVKFWSGGNNKARFWGGDANDQGGQLFMYGLGSQPTVQLDGYNGSGGDVVITTETGTQAASMGATSSGGLIRCRDAAGNITVSIDGQYSDGNGRVITEVLEITGGSDLSEQFSVSPAEVISALEPGMVVSIDPQNPGELRVCDSPYDRKVAGVISGAGGVRPGMLMGQKGSLADGEHPVALTGRVYVQADASNGPIEAGDLLTSSDQPGRAMKVTDHARANGAILGKAMTRLAEGEGLVLVLVSLQ